MRSVNLIPKHRRQTRRRTVRLRRWTIICITYVAVLALGYGMCRAVWLDNRDLAAELLDVEEQIEGSNQAIDSLTLELSEARVMLDASRRAVHQPDWSVLMALMSKALDEQIVLKEFRLGRMLNVESQGPTARRSRAGRTGLLNEMPAAFTLELNGYGRTPKAVSGFVLRLEQTDMFKQVTQRSTNREPFMAGDAIAFRITCTLDSREVPD